VPLDQKNLGFFSYDSDDATSYCLKGDKEWGDAAASGGSACTGEPAYGRATTRRAPRFVIFRDPTTFRTFRGVVYTPAAYAALTVGSSTRSITLPGSATPQTYTVVKKVPEKIPSTVIGRQLSDHA
jgi:hypothetical protein